MMHMTPLTASLLKYFVEGLAVAFVAALLVRNGKMDAGSIVVLGLTAALTFAVLDRYVPVAGVGARLGAGAATGVRLLA